MLLTKSLAVWFVESKAFRELMFRFWTTIVSSSAGKASRLPREGRREAWSRDDGGDGSGGGRTGRRALYFRLEIRMYTPSLSASGEGITSLATAGGVAIRGEALSVRASVAILDR